MAGICAPLAQDVDRPRWMDKYEVVQGKLNRLEELEGDCLADIAGILLILPAMIGLEFQSHVGERVGIIHLDRQNYRVRKPEVS